MFFVAIGLCAMLGCCLIIQYYHTERSIQNTDEALELIDDLHVQLHAAHEEIRELKDAQKS